MAAKTKKVIITCAVTGGIHTPTMSDHLPIGIDILIPKELELAA